MAGNVKQIMTSDEVLHDLEVDLSGYYDKTETDALLDAKANASGVYTKSETDLLLSTKADNTDIYTKAQLDALFDSKANVNTVYTKGETDTLLTHKADVTTTYTKSETDTLLLSKADANDVYPKSQTYSRTQTDDLLATKADNTSVYSKSDVDTLLAGKEDTGVAYTKAEADELLGAKANSADVYTITQTDALLEGKASIDDSSTTSTVATWSADKLHTEFQNTPKLDSDNVFEGGNTLKDHYTTIKMSNLDVTDDTISPLDGNAGIPIVDKNGVALAYINIWQRTENNVVRCDLAIGTEIGSTNPNGRVLINGVPSSPFILAQNLTAGGTIGDKLQEIATALLPHQNYLGRIILEVNGIAMRWTGGADWSAGPKLNGTTEYVWYLVNFTAGSLQMRQVYTSSGNMGGNSLNNEPFTGWRIYTI